MIRKFIIMVGTLLVLTPTAAHSSTITHHIKEKASGYKEAERLYQWFPASDFEPAGLYLDAGEKIEIHVEQIKGTSQPVLLVGTYSRYKSSDVPNVYSLKAGINTIQDKKGGLLYLRYVSDSKPSGEVRVTLKGGKIVAMFKLGQTEIASWHKMLETTTAPDVIFIGERVFVVTSRETAIKHKGLDQNKMLQNLDSISNIEDRICGLNGSSELHRPNIHKVMITETADKDVFMAAAEYRIMIRTWAMGQILNPHFTSTKGWGIWHEMGHMRQVLSWCWDEIDEVSVNIYSLAVKRAFQSKMHWLEGNKVWESIREYFSLPSEKRDYNNDLDVMGRLVMFDQLGTVFGDAFWVKIHRLTREEKAKTPETEDMMAYFMKVASKACGYNLKQFFIEWGFKLPQKDFDALDDLKLPPPSPDLLSVFHP